MTQVVATATVETPPAARAGLVLPGLGHLLTGRWVDGVGLLAIDLLLFVSAWAGAPRLGEVTGITELRVSPHGVLSVLTWLGMAGGTWYTAWRYANPVELAEEERDANRERFIRGFRRNRNGMMGLYGVILMLGITMLTPLIAPFDPDMIDAGPKVVPPSLSYLMGTDEYGRDMFSRVLYGARISMSIGFVAVTIAATLGTSVGAISGYYGGRVDSVLMWIADLLLSLPRIVLLLAIVGLFRVNGVGAIFLMMAVLGAVGWPGVSRIVRSQVLSLKEQDFVQAARAMGMPTSRIIFRHLIPNATAPVIVYCSLAIGGTMLAEAALSFLGLGVTPPTSTWGTLVATGRERLLGAPWIATFPGLMIVWAVMSFNLLGDGLRDALDPKQAGR